VRVDESEPAPREPSRFDEPKHLVVFDDTRLRQLLKQRNDLGPIREVPADELADHEGMTEDFGSLKKGSQLGASLRQMRNPDRRVDQDQHQLLDARRLGIARRFFSVAPSSANRLLDSRAMRASRPSRTRAVFSFTPVSSAARFSVSSWMFSVVLMQMSMHIGGILGKRGAELGTRAGHETPRVKIRPRAGPRAAKSQHPSGTGSLRAPTLQAQALTALGRIFGESARLVQEADWTGGGSTMNASGGNEEVQGDIAYYGLAEWWLSAFTPVERQMIEARYLSGVSSLTRGRQSTSQPVTEFLNGLAGWFRIREYASIAERIRRKIDELGRTNPLHEPGCYNGRHFTTYVADVEALKREGKLIEAEQLLLELVAATEREDEIDKMGAAPWYYEQLAIIYRKRKEPAKEVAILERCLAHDHQHRLALVLSDRLRKAHALLAASNAKPVSPCPHCGTEMPIPSSTTCKCPACGEKVVRAKRPGEEFPTLFTAAQAEENKKGLELARARKKALEHARKIGCTDNEFAAKECELAKKWGRAASPGDVFWGISNDLLSKAASTFDQYRWGTLQNIYEHQARVLLEEGRPYVHVVKEASKAHLHELEQMCSNFGLKHEVYIATSTNCCPDCARLAGKRMSFREALGALPIPNEQCTHGRCQCSWRIDYGDTLK